MGSKKTRKMSRSSTFKKRLCQGNKHTKTIRSDEGVSSLPRPNVPTQPSGQAETSQGDPHEVEGTPPYKKQKLAVHDARNDLNNEGSNNYFVFIYMHPNESDIISWKMSGMLLCHGMIDLLNLRMGFAHKIIISCASCSWEQSIFLSEQCSPATGRGRHFFEINVRSLIAFREIGKGHQAIRCFSRCMNMKSISKNGYSNLIKELCDAYLNAADVSKSKAALEIKQYGVKEVDGKHLCQCSLDGSWQKRGHASLNGVVTAIASGKWLDTGVFAKNCKSCQKWQSKKGTPEYESWFAAHDCKINHKKSSGATTFCSSVEKQLTFFAVQLKSMD